MSQEPKVVSTQTVHCNEWGDEGVDALLVVYDNGTVEVHCEGLCEPCRYGKQVN